MKYKVLISTYDSAEEYTVEAESKSKARYKAFNDAKASGDFAACITFWQFLDLFKPDVIPIIEAGGADNGNG